MKKSRGWAIGSPRDLRNLLRASPEEFRADVVALVPLHPDRQRERGYNQAELIARPLARRLHLNKGACLLVRTKPRPARLVLSRKETGTRYVASTLPARVSGLTSFAFYW
jgi:hypothetical protein